MKRGAFVLALALVAAPARAAPDKLRIEAQLDTPMSVVDLQATLTVRFLHAVDVTAPTVEVEPTRLAELHLLAATQGETREGGLRYRVLERRYAVLPFASGPLELVARASGTTPATLPGVDRTGRFERTTTTRLDVAPAAPGGPWFPARAVTLTPMPLPVAARQGEALRYAMRVEADGADGSTIAPLSWPADPAWSVAPGSVRVGRRIEGGRVFGWREENVDLTPLAAGPLQMPSPSVRWWSAGARTWTQSAAAAPRVEVAPGEPNAPPPAPRPTGAPPWTAVVALVVLVVLAVFVRRPGRAIWRHSCHVRRLARAEAAADTAAARAALAALYGTSSLSRLACRAAAAGYADFAARVRALEHASFGPPPAPAWSGLCHNRPPPRLLRAVPPTADPA